MECTLVHTHTHTHTHTQNHRKKMIKHCKLKLVGDYLKFANSNSIRKEG
jgi:hypothetical protein